MINVPNAASPGDGAARKTQAEAADFFEALRRELPGLIRKAVRAELDAAETPGNADVPEPLLTKDDVAARLSVSPRTVDTLAAEGALRRIKVRGCVRFHPDAVDAYIRSQADGGRSTR